MTEPGGLPRSALSRHQVGIAVTIEVHGNHGLEIIITRADVLLWQVEAHRGARAGGAEGQSKSEERKRRAQEPGTASGSAC
jgi:hypothetical protein